MARTGVLRLILAACILPHIFITSGPFSGALAYSAAPQVYELRDIGEVEFEDVESSMSSFNYSSYSSYSIIWSSTEIEEYTWDDLYCSTESCSSYQTMRLCRCDALCALFNDCCRDATISDAQIIVDVQDFLDGDLWECVVFEHMCADPVYGENEGFYLVSHCPSEWQDNEMRRSCADQGSEKPVVVDDRGVHFLNEDCARCHGADIASLEIYIEFIDHPCPIYDSKCAVFRQPREDANGTKQAGVPDPHFCFPSLKASCPDDDQTMKTMNATTRALCEETFAPVSFESFGSAVLFANRECALCNGYFPYSSNFSVNGCPGQNIYRGSTVSCLGEPLYFSFFDYTANQRLVAKVTFGISCAALSLTFITYCVFKSLRNLQGVLVMQFIVTLFLAQVLQQFVAPSLKERCTYEAMYGSGEEGLPVCVRVAVSAYFFSLAAFFLMTVMAWDLSRNLGGTSMIARRRDGGISKARLVLYSSIGWGCPLAITCCLVGLHVHSILTGNYDLFYFGGSDCWLHPAPRTIQTFLVPVVACLAFNFALFVRVVIQLRKIKKECAVLNVGHRSDRQNKDTTQALRLYFKISCLFGFGWLFGYLSAFVDVPELMYLFIIINSLQGVLFWISFAMNKRSRGLWKSATTERLNWLSSSIQRADIFSLSTYRNRGEQPATP